MKTIMKLNILNSFIRFLDPDLENTSEILHEPENSDETRWECLISYDFQSMKILNKSG